MDRKSAEKLLLEAKSMNEGAWIEHSYNVAHLAIFELKEYCDGKINGDLYLLF